MNKEKKTIVGKYLALKARLDELREDEDEDE